MKFLYLYILCFLISGSLLSQQKATPDFHAEVISLKEKDNLEAYTYAYLDEFLKNPTNFSLLEEMHISRWRDPQTAAEALSMTILLCNEGYYRMQYSQIESAVHAYEQAWRYFQQYDFQNFDVIEYCLKPLGNAYSMLGDYVSAENIIKSYLLKTQDGKSDQMVAAFINLSIVYHDTGQYEKAINILNKALDEKPAAGKLGLVYSNLAKNYLQVNKLNKAKTTALQALKFFKKEAQQENRSYLVNTYSTLSLISLQNQDTIQALNFLNEAKDMARAGMGVKRRELAKIEIQLAGIWSATRYRDEALTGYREALKLLIPAMDETTDLPVDSLLYAENALKEVFDGMAAVYTRKKMFEKAISCYKKSFEVEELLKETYNYKEAGYLHQNENRKRAERVISMYHQLFLADNDTSHINQAFRIAERTKSIALKDELNSKRSWARFVNDSLYTTRINLKKQQALLENALIQEELKGEEADINTIKYLLDKKNKSGLALKQIDQTIEGKLGHSYYGNTPIDLEEIQTKVSRDKITLIEYFFGSESLYVFVLNGSTVELHKNEHVTDVRETALQYTKFFTDEVKINAAPEVFADISQKLYSLLLPVKPKTTILIIPDGLLNFLPFEALLSSAPANMNFSTWPWLIKQTPIFYQYSAASYLPHSYSEKFDSRKVLGMFPQFEDSKMFLKYSKDEAGYIEEYFDGNYINKQQATKQAFLKNAGEYAVIHLSTHARAGGLHEPPSITFIDSALYLTEIYGMNLQTELLVLGACETGIGKLYKGEGPLSLANGLFSCRSKEYRAIAMEGK